MCQEAEAPAGALMRIGATADAVSLREMDLWWRQSRGSQPGYSEELEVAARNGQWDIAKLLFERRDEGKLGSYFAAFLDGYIVAKKDIERDKIITITIS